MVEVVVVGAMNVFFGSGIYYFIVMFILFYCVESYNKSTAAVCV